MGCYDRRGICSQLDQQMDSAGPQGSGLCTKPIALLFGIVRSGWARQDAYLSLTDLLETGR